MKKKEEHTNKEVVVKSYSESKKFWMAEKEYTGIIVSKEQTNSEYIISDGVIQPGGFIPDHYHKWEDQTFHVMEGNLKAKIGNTWYTLKTGDSVHCPRGTSHYMKNEGDTTAKLVSYIFPGDWAEDYFEETSKQSHSGQKDLKLIEEKFGVVYI